MTSAAFFDLDKTIIAKSSALAFGKPLYRAGFVNRRMVAKAAIAQVFYSAFGADHDRMEQVRERMIALIRGWNATELRSIAAEAIEEVVAPLVYQEALELIGHHKESDRKVIVISTSPEEIVVPLANYLGGIDEVIATRSVVGEDGTYTGELEFYAYGPSKAEAVIEFAEREGIDLAECFAYSDSITDEPMLSAVGHPVAVNPDRELRTLAQHRSWEVRDFVKPVSLNSRMAPYRKPAGIGTAVVAAASGALYMWLKMRARPRS
jgi:HAD superfamily hydrolase (TIGR01490 family)